MKKLCYCLVSILTFFVHCEAQDIVNLNFSSDGKTVDIKVIENITYTENGIISRISNVTIPSMTVYLPNAKIATGTAVIVLPGGALQFLSWDDEGVKVAKWLNEKGIAAFVLKYRLYNSNMQSSITVPQQTTVPVKLTVDQFDQLTNANANPSNDPQLIKVLNLAASDAREAIRIIRNRAKEWKINPDRIGYMGFSAGGGVALSAVIGNTDKETMPDFIGSAYGPSLVDLVVPSPAPPLFIATNTNHMNVAAGCLALFTTWKKAGGNAEIHIYDIGVGPFGMNKKGTPSDTWIESFHTWLLSSGF